MVLPRLDWTETSPSAFFSATSPDGAEPFQFHEAVGEGKDVSHVWVIAGADDEKQALCAQIDE